MSIEFLLDESRKELEKLDNAIKELGIVKKQDGKTRFLKKFIIEAIRSRHHGMSSERHGLDKIPLRPLMIEPARRQISYFKPHEIHKLARLPERKKYFTISEHEYPLLREGNYTIVRAVMDDKYRVIEPPLTEMDLKIINDVKAKGMTDEGHIRIELEGMAGRMGAVLSDDYVRKITYYANRNNILGKIAMIIMDNRIKTISCAGLNQNVHVTVNGKDMETDIMYHNLNEINSVVIGLAKLANTEVTSLDPILDETLQTGTRLQGVFGNNIVTPKFLITR